MCQKSMTNSLFKIRARAFGVETPASRYRRVIIDILRLYIYIYIYIYQGHVFIGYTTCTLYT